MHIETLDAYLHNHGPPVAFYSGLHRIFRVNRFSRALKKLDIGVIGANAPQVKGRVGRANQTLQDRLIKELRLHSISGIDAANAFLPEFIADFNRRFAKPPQSPVDAHRPLLRNADELAPIHSTHHTRKLSKNFTFHSIAANARSPARAQV